MRHGTANDSVPCFEKAATDAPMHEGLLNSKRPSLDALTGVRFFAAFAVFMFHYGASFSEQIGVPKPLTTFLHNGYYGVSMFFVLSGFIMTYTYTGKLSTKIELYEFAVARIARIYPVYLLVLVIALPVLTSPMDSREVVAVLLMLQSWTPAASNFGYTWVMQAWTLSVEMFFYAIFPLVLAICGGLQLRGITTGMILVGTAIVAFGLPTITPGTQSIPLIPNGLGLPLPVLRSFEFVFGLLLCRFMFMAPQTARTLARGPITFLTITLIVAILSFSVNSQITALATILFGLLIIQLAISKSLLVTFLSTRVILLLGGASYALYLAQGPIREWVRLLIPGKLLGSVVNPLVALLVAIAIFMYFERPFRRFVRDALMIRTKPPAQGTRPVKTNT